MDSLSPKYVAPAPELAWAPDLEEVGAGIFLLAGRWHVAQHHSPEALELAAAGALHVANLCFTPDPYETRHSGRAVRALDARAAARSFPSTASRS